MKNVTTDFMCLQALGKQKLVKGGEVFLLFIFIKLIIAPFSCVYNRTFTEINKPAELYRKCEELCMALSEDLKSEQLKVCLSTV